MRLFVAIPVPPLLSEIFVPIQYELVATQAPIKLVNAGSMHLTLLFLGEVKKEAISSIIQRLEHIAATTHPFFLSCHGLGCFGSNSSPSVIWAGIAPSEQLLALFMQIRTALADVKVDDYSSPHPHITLARVRSQSKKKEILATINFYKSVHFGDFFVSSFVLYESRLTLGRSVYVARKTLFLGKSL